MNLIAGILISEAKHSKAFCVHFFMYGFLFILCFEVTVYNPYSFNVSRATKQNTSVFALFKVTVSKKILLILQGQVSFRLVRSFKFKSL